LPVTPIDIGFADLVPPSNNPHEYFPTGFNIFPVVTRPTILEFESTLHVIIPIASSLDMAET